MTTVNTTYPLEQILFVKQKRVELAEIVVREKREALDKEEKKLKKCQEALEKVEKHHQDKLDQMREELDHETTSPKVQQMKVYLKVVKEKVKVEEKKVKDQQALVDIAEKNLAEAKLELNRRRHEVDKLLFHREDWQKELKKELVVIENREEDEVSSIIFSKNRRGRER